MGAVYVATHALLGRKAAVKVLLPSMSQDDVVQRFFNEARAATAIKHPGIVEVFDYGQGDDGSAYIVMELLEGESLRARLERLGTVSPEFAVAVSKQVASALAAAHEAGIVHRDLKPDNVFLVRDPDVPMGERIKLLDFGIAKLVSTDGGHDMALTQTGALLGTPYYMSPEQCRGAAKVDARTDLYSLGCMLFQMVTGRVPFVGEGLGEILAAHIHVAPPAPRTLGPDLPPDLEALILRLLAKAPADRPASADALIDELAALGTAPRSPPRMSKPPPLAAGVQAPLVAGAAPDGLAETQATASEAAKSATPARRRPTALLFVAGAVLVVAGASFAVFSSRGDAVQTVAHTSADAAMVAPPDASTVVVTPLDDAALAVAEPLPDAAIARRPPKPTDKNQRDATQERRPSSGPGLGSYVAPPPGSQPAPPPGGPTWPQPAPPKWRTEFTFAPVSVSDPSERDEIMREYESRKNQIQYCYGDRYLEGRKIPGAKVSIKMVVPLGREFAKATVTGGDAIAARCVRAVLQGVTWPPLKSATPVTMTTSFVVTVE